MRVGRSVIWFLLGWVLVGVPMLAFADYPSRTDWSIGAALANPRYATGNEACGGGTRFIANPFETLSDGFLVWASCRDSATGNNLTGRVVYQNAYCDYGGTPSGKSCVNPPECPAGEVRDPVTGQCKPSQCQAGTDKVVSLGIGYVSTFPGSPSDPVTPPPGGVPSSVCSDSCVVSSSLTNVVSGSCAATQSESGMHPVTCQVLGMRSGATCSAGGSVPAEGTNLPPQPCPAGTSYGSVAFGGVTKTGCFGSYGSSEATQTVQNPDGSTVKTTVKVAPDGSKVKETETTAPDGAKTVVREVITRTPAAPPSPSGTLGDPAGTGSGSGGEPGSGSGAGSGAGKPADKGDTEQADFCRDNPKAAFCQEKVKIDESGTPSSAPGVEAGFQSSLDAVIAQAQYLEGMGWLRNGIPLVWNPAANLPGGACYSWDFGHGEINPCPTAERIRNWWSFAIVFLAGLYAWHRATSIFKG